MTTFQILYWYDIPMQVRAQEGRNRVSRPLPDRFQEAVDRASMAAGLTGTDAYLEQMRWGETQSADASPQEVVDQVILRLETEFKTIAWQATAAALREKLKGE